MDILGEFSVFVYPVKKKFPRENYLFFLFSCLCFRFDITAVTWYRAFAHTHTHTHTKHKRGGGETLTKYSKRR
jgi:hypothetical protein